MEVFDPQVAYGTVDDKRAISLMEMVRHGIEFETFDKFVNKSPFSINEWSSYLHLSERTMQRYKNENRRFEALQSEKIIEIALLYNKGIEVFGETERFNAWIETENLALGKIKPKSLLDNSFGINLIFDELVRIEYGVLA
jgi:putative toxin-antitoxin system antitoxin component (TIGR02293 family)